MPESVARESLRLAADKLPVRTKFLTRHHVAANLTNMKFKEIQEMSTDELLTKKRDLRQESLHLRLQQQSGQLEQPSRLRLSAPGRGPDRDRALGARQAEAEKK